MAELSKGPKSEAATKALNLHDPIASSDNNKTTSHVSEMDETQCRSSDSSGSTLPITSHHCAKCKTPSTLWCRACCYDEETKQESPTWYCCKDCQVKDWPEHKSRCLHVRGFNRLYRTAHLLESAFCDFRMQMFDLPIARASKKGGKLVIYEGAHPHGSCKPLWPFPEQLFPDLRDKKAALTMMACEDAVGRMHHGFAEALKGVYKEIEELRINVKLQQRICPAVFVHTDGFEENEDRDHKVILVTLKDNSVYVVDIGQAQYGWNTLVHTWEDYWKHRIRHGGSFDCQPFGHWKAHCTNWIQCSDPLLKAVYHNNTQGQMHFDAVLDAWLEREGLKMAALMELKRDKYEAKSAELLTHLASSMKDFVKKGKKTDELYVSVKIDQFHKTGTFELKKGNGSVQRMTNLF